MSEGADWPDPDFLANVVQAEANGVSWGAYQFARFDLSRDGASEARYFLIRLPRIPRILALDVEVGDGDLSGPTLAFFRCCEDAGVTPDRLYLYTNRSFIESQGLDNPALARYRLWLAAPGPVKPAAPAPWSVVSIWQSSWHGTIAGVSGDVDLDVILEK